MRLHISTENIAIFPYRNLTIQHCQVTNQLGKQKDKKQLYFIASFKTMPDSTGLYSE